MAELSNFVVCGFCQEQVDKSLFDACDAVQSCPQCGSVLAEEQMFSYELAISKSTSSSLKNIILPTQNNYACRDRQPKLRPSLFTPSENELKALVARSCEKLQLSKEITQQIQDFLLCKANPAFTHMNKKIRLVGACIYIVCRNNDLTVTLKQVAVATGCTVFELGNIAKVIDARFGLHRMPVTIQSLITLACSDMPLAKECEELAQQLCSRSSESMLLNGTPLPQAIAYCVLASLAVNKGANQGQEISKLCLKMSQVSEKTVVHCIRLLKNYMMTLLEAIPWVNKDYVKMSNIHHYIKDITKYEQNCGKFPAKVANPQWCHERESEIQTRKAKIHNALERIRLRQCSTVCAISGRENGSAVTEIDAVVTEMNSSTTLDTTNTEGNVTTESNSSILSDATVNIENDVNAELNSSVAMDTALDKEDKLIEELLELGCSPQQVQEGFYQNLKTTSSSVNHEIAESEIESYVRKPDEVNELKRMIGTDDDFVSMEGKAKKIRRKSLKCRPLHKMSNA